MRLTDAWSDEQVRRVSAVSRVPDLEQAGRVSYLRGILTVFERLQIHYPGDSWDDGGAANLYGNLKALYLLKQRNRHFKVLLSIGGWTYSENGRFACPVSTPPGRTRFVETAVKLVEDYGLDGLDIDWEYPQNDKEAQDYVELLRLLRGGLDELQRKLGVQPPSGFELTIAAVRLLFCESLVRNENAHGAFSQPCGPSNMEKLRVREMDQYLSFWNLMACVNPLPPRHVLRLTP